MRAPSGCVVEVARTPTAIATNRFAFVTRARGVFDLFRGFGASRIGAIWRVCIFYVLRRLECLHAVAMGGSLAERALSLADDHIRWRLERVLPRFQSTTRTPRCRPPDRQQM